MSEIKIVEKIVAPNTNWTQLILKEDDESLARCAYKIIFDRTYPYFWIWPRGVGYRWHGVALTYSDVERAAILDEVTGEFVKFEFAVDGVLPLDGNAAVCIAMGARQAFYILSNTGYLEGQSGTYEFYISAQDDPVCPFVVANPWTA